jgi:hypothetical protein
MRIELIGLALMAVLILTGCTPTMKEDINYAIYKERQRWNATDRVQEFKDFFDYDALFQTYEGKERQAEREVCLHPNKQYRVTRQGNVEDRVEYIHCVVQPLPREEPGQRLNDRPRV